MTKSTTLIFFTLVVLGLCSFTAYAGSSSKQNLDVVLFYNIFKDWVSEYQKGYGIDEMAVRFYNWKANYDMVQEFNSKDSDVKLGMNRFAALTPEEFSALHLGLNVNLKKQSNLQSSSNTTESDDDDYNFDYSDDTDNSDDTDSTTDANSNNGTTLLGAQKKKTGLAALPKSVDWRKKGAVSAVKNQGKCGGCWAFAASGALEGLHAIKNRKLVSFSDQQMIDCSATYGNQGCDGGLMTNAFQYTQDHGIQPENAYAYTAAVKKCKQNPQKVVFRNTGFKEVKANNHTALKAAVARQPVSVGLEASSMTLQLFKSGVITANCGATLDHGVLIVGYDKTPKGQEYWIVKNSWGPQWGLNGYFHVAMGSQNNGAGLCGINMMASYPTV